MNGAEGLDGIGVLGPGVLGGARGTADGPGGSILPVSLGQFQGIIEITLRVIIEAVLDVFRDQQGIPHAVKVVGGLAPLDLGIVTTTVTGRVVQGLVDITHEVNNELQGLLTGLDVSRAGGGGGLETLKSGGHVVERIHVVLTIKDIVSSATLWRVVTDGVEEVQVGRPLVGSKATDIVSPRGNVGEETTIIFGIKNLANLSLCLGRQELLGDLSSQSVANDTIGLSLGAEEHQGRGRNHGERGCKAHGRVL